MFTNSYELTLLATGTPTGDKVRLLAAATTPDTRAGTTVPAPAVAVLTTDPETGETLRRCLTRFTDSRYALLARWVAAHPGRTCALRRAAGVSLAASPDLSLGERLSGHAADLHELAPVLDAIDQLTGGARKAATDLVLDMLAGADEVPVRVHLSSDELDHGLGDAYANAWLRDCPDELVVQLREDPEELMEAEVQFSIRENLPWLEELLEEVYVDFTLDETDLAAWIRRHRPHLADQ